VSPAEQWPSAGTPATWPPSKFRPSASAAGTENPCRIAQATESASANRLQRRTYASRVRTIPPQRAETLQGFQAADQRRRKPNSAAGERNLIAFRARGDVVKFSSGQTARHRQGRPSSGERRPAVIEERCAKPTWPLRSGPAGKQAPDARCCSFPVANIERLEGHESARARCLGGSIPLRRQRCCGGERQVCLSRICAQPSQ